MGRITSSRKQLKPDPVYGSLLASKFINTLMHDGKKSVAQNVFYDALEIVKKRVPDKEPIEVFTNGPGLWVAGIGLTILSRAAYQMTREPAYR